MGPEGKGGRAVPVPPLFKRGDAPFGEGDIGERARPFWVPVVPEGNNPPAAPGRAALPREKNIHQSPRRGGVFGRKVPPSLTIANRKLNFLYRGKLKGGAEDG